MNRNEFIVIFTGVGNYAGPVWETYKTYVLADGGTVEAQDCTINELANLL
jgi:hypothetical protein